MVDDKWPRGSGGGPTDCEDVGCTRGGLDPVLGVPFREAYEAVGGRDRVGCPREDDPSGWVGPWGPGWRQDLRGGSECRARIMALGPKTVVVMSGRWHDDYTLGSGHGRDSAEVLGYPLSPPFPFGRTLVVRMSGGTPQPGLMVADPDGTMRWVPRSVAVPWLRSGGPDGPFGLPVGNVRRTRDREEQQFEGSTLTPGSAVRPGGAQAGRPPAPEASRLLAELLADGTASPDRLDAQRPPAPSRPAAAPPAPAAPGKDYFVCHAGPDKDRYVRPVVRALEAADVSCWLDEAEVLPGDSLTRAIYDGLGRSAYVLAVITPAFVGRPWPEHELDTSFGRQASRGQVRVVPLFHGIGDQDMSRLLDRYPVLEDVLRLRWEDGPHAVVGQLERRLGRQYAEGWEHYHPPEYSGPVWFRVVGAPDDAGRSTRVRATWGRWEYRWDGPLPGGRGPLTFRHHKAADHGDALKLRVEVVPDAHVVFGTGTPPEGALHETGSWSPRES